MKKIILALGLVFILAACDQSSTVTTVAPAPVVHTYATVSFNDESVLGTTRIEPIMNGGFQIYNIGTGEVAGFIQADTAVNDLYGNDLGLCNGAVISDNGVKGDCTLPVPNPDAPVIDDGTCKDTRNGDFNPSYSPIVCNENGYFWCSLAQQCLDKPVNVPQCGEIGER